MDKLVTDTPLPGNRWGAWLLPPEAALAAPHEPGVGELPETRCGREQTHPNPSLFPGRGL